MNRDPLADIIRRAQAVAQATLGDGPHSDKERARVEKAARYAGLYGRPEDVERAARRELGHIRAEEVFARVDARARAIRAYVASTPPLRVRGGSLQFYREPTGKFAQVLAYLKDLLGC